MAGGQKIGNLKAIGLTNDSDVQINPATEDKQDDIIDALEGGSISTDLNGRDSLNTVFGEKIIGTRIPSFAAQFQYGVATDQGDVVTANGGTATTEDSLLKVSTSTNTAGAARIQTTDYLRYIPGHEAYINFTGVFTEGVADSWQRAGLFDDDNGFFIGYEGTQFTFTRRRDGTDYNHSITLDDVFVGFDPTKGNIYRISFGYLGFAAISLEVMKPSGGWTLAHKIEYPNAEEVTHITQTNLPARAQVANEGNATDVVFYSGSYEFGIVDGGGADPAARAFSGGVNDVTISEGEFAVVTFRNKSTFKSIENRISARLLLISASTEVNKLPAFTLIRNATITNTPTWTDVNTDDSTFEYSTDALVSSGTGDVLLPWDMSKVDSFFENVRDFNVKLRPGETSTVLLTTAAGASGEVSVAFRWEELF
jgi:hypothetical protein